MSQDAEQLEFSFPDWPPIVACVSPMHRMTVIPTTSMTPPPGRPPSELRPDYATTEDAPSHVIQEAQRERYAWIRRYVQGGWGPDWKLLASAIAHARSTGRLPSEVPPLEELRTWAIQYRCWQLQGLLQKPSR